MTEAQLLSRHTLRVKIKYLSEEARIIRFEECRTKNSFIKENLRDHRLDIVRYEQRHSLLAYAFIRNVPYKVVENKAEQKPNVKKIIKILANHAPYLENPEKALIEWLNT